ncbi:hypothetical protein Y032_0836g2602 [Ancylostoma ceylanicum]|uniref:Uncharacterized protein n=1 Tax=Ancylostoma ceylanicum TaxID=53326 RepID=A0A016WCJ8_9BILA|nr:hypothetical protein Y032_0836g2602 [Ancylostoma ceylanicum]
MFFRVLIVLCLISAALGFIAWPQAPEYYRSDVFRSALFGNLHNGIFFTNGGRAVSLKVGHVFLGRLKLSFLRCSKVVLPPKTVVQMFFRVLVVLCLISAALSFVIWPQAPEDYRSDTFGNILFGNQHNGFFLTCNGRVCS